jgi:hypothetical protein
MIKALIGIIGDGNNKILCLDTKTKTILLREIDESWRNLNLQTIRALKPVKMEDAKLHYVKRDMAYCVDVDFPVDTFDVEKTGCYDACVSIDVVRYPEEDMFRVLESNVIAFANHKRMSFVYSLYSNSDFSDEVEELIREGNREAIEINRKSENIDKLLNDTYDGLEYTMFDDESYVLKLEDKKKEMIDLSIFDKITPDAMLTISITIEETKRLKPLFTLTEAQFNELEKLRLEPESDEIKTWKDCVDKGIIIIK